jgi:hypothetical protein
MKITAPKIPFICFHLFFGIGPFQRVTSEKIKKFLSVPTRVLGCALRFAFSVTAARERLTDSDQPY